MSKTNGNEQQYFFKGKGGTGRPLPGSHDVTVDIKPKELSNNEQKDKEEQPERERTHRKVKRGKRIRRKFENFKI